MVTVGGDRGQSAVRRLVPIVLVIGTAAILGYIVADIGQEVYDNVVDRDLSTVDENNKTAYENSSESIASGFAGGMSLVEVVFIVMMASVILAVLGGVMRFR